MDLTFELLCDVLCDPLWFNDLYLTTKSHQGLTKVHKELFQQPRLPFRLALWEKERGKFSLTR